MEKKENPLFPLLVVLVWRNQDFPTLFLGIFSDKQSIFLPLAIPLVSFTGPSRSSRCTMGLKGKKRESHPSRKKQASNRTSSKEFPECRKHMVTEFCSSSSEGYENEFFFQENLCASSMELEGRIHWIYLTS